MIEAIVIVRSLEGEQLGHYFLASHLLTLRIAFVCYTSRFSRNFLLITMNVIFLRSKSGRAFFDKQLKTREIRRERLYSRGFTWYRLRSRCLHYQSNFKFNFCAVYSTAALNVYVLNIFAYLMEIKIMWRFRFSLKLE